MNRSYKQVVGPGHVVTLDAMFTHQSVSQTILSQQADYILFAKGNQEELVDSLNSIVRLETAYGNGCRQVTSCDKAHGRIEERCLTVVKVPKGLVAWPGITYAFVLERKTLRKGKQNHESILGLTSLMKVQPRHLLKWVRSHWTIENRLHWVKDVVFGEDKALIACQNAAHIMAGIRSAVVSALFAQECPNISATIRQFCAQPAQALKLIGWDSDF